ncbi:MAG: glycosyltransferase family A protein [Prochlorococcaceae cyanobacterium]
MDDTNRTYAVLIRTFNSESTLPATIASLRAQTCPAGEWVFVDSGSTDATQRLIPCGAKWHRYTGADFNYSRSLNEGIAHVRLPLVLIISSHTRLENSAAMAYSLSLLKSDPLLGGVYFSDEPNVPLQYTNIERESFDGFNGLMNTCALVRTQLLRERPFREEVFSAEDQEWSAWLLNERGGRIARMSGAERHCDNPQKYSPLKTLNEYVSIAYFTNRRLLKWRNIGRQLWLACAPASARRSGRRFYLRLALRLVACHFHPPRYSSKYF